MSSALDSGWTKARFLAWAERQEARFEFDGTRPVAMTGGNGWHSAITGNTITALRTRLRGKACSVYGPDLAIETPGGKIRYPDALVTCTKFPGSAKLAPNPVKVFEVLSPGSGGTDRIEKLREYAGVASILRHVILEGERVAVTVLERTDPNQT
jgi:Uma2 family endonuclease